MKKVLKISAYAIGFILLLLGIFALYVNFAPAPVYDPPTIPDLKVEATPERVAQGAKLASMLCIVCHIGTDGKLSGNLMPDVPKEFGKFYSKNITQHPERGIGNWTDGEIAYFLRTGLRKDGSYAPPGMIKMPLAADEDIISIIAWLRSADPRVQASDHIPGVSQYTFLAKALTKFVFKPYPYPSQPVPLPDTTQQIAWGKYLANNVYGCFGCHSESFQTTNDLEPEKSGGYYGGGNPLLDMDGHLMPSANITPDPETGIGSWNQEQFLQAVKYGKRPDGSLLRYPMQPHTPLSDNEVNAMYAFLKTVPPIKNAVVRGK